MNREAIDVQICAYHALLGQGQSIIDSTGTIYSEACECGATLRHWKDDGELWVCGKCGVSWQHDDHDIFKGEVSKQSRNGKPVQTSRPGEYEDRLAALAHFGYHLNQMSTDAYWRYPTQVLVGNALTSCGYEEIAIHANAYGWRGRLAHGEVGAPEIDYGWTAARCEDWAGRAAQELSHRLWAHKEHYVL